MKKKVLVQLCTAYPVIFVSTFQVIQHVINNDFRTTHCYKCFNAYVADITVSFFLDPQLVVSYDKSYHNVLTNDNEFKMM